MLMNFHSPSKGLKTPANVWPHLKTLQISTFHCTRISFQKWTKSISFPQSGSVLGTWHFLHNQSFIEIQICSPPPSFLSFFFFFKSNLKGMYPALLDQPLSKHSTDFQQVWAQMKTMDLRVDRDNGGTNSTSETLQTGTVRIQRHRRKQSTANLLTISLFHLKLGLVFSTVLLC